MLERTVYLTGLFIKQIIHFTQGHYVRQDHYVTQVHSVRQDHHVRQGDYVRQAHYILQNCKSKMKLFCFIMNYYALYETESLYQQVHKKMEIIRVKLV